MNTFDIAKRSLVTVWTHKKLWLFGLFVAGTGGGSGGGSSGASPAAVAPLAAEGTAVAEGAPLAETVGRLARDAESFPGWLPWAIAAGVVFLLAVIVCHILSEGALIDGVRRDREKRRVSIGDGLRAGATYFGSILAVKAALLGLGLLAALPLIAAVVAGASEVVAGRLAAALMVLVAIPTLAALLSIYVIYEVAQRMVVLDARSALDAIRWGRRFVHGRLALCLKLLIWSFVGQLGGGLAALVAAIPGVVVGGAVFLLAGLGPAFIAGTVVSLPLFLAAIGASGCFRSAIWTHALLTARAES